MISIYTHTNNPIKKEFWKWIIKKILRRYSGPDAVLSSMKRGLSELNIPFEINPLKPKYKIIHVLSGVDILKNRIKNKKNDQFLTVGPTVVLTPEDENNLLSDSNINIILTPSQWVTDFYNSLTPQLKDKTYSWPAGVMIPKIQTTKTGEITIFKKNISNDILNKISEILKNNSISYEIIEYGNFTHTEYIEKLKTTPLIIYLQTSESQGIALQEAWSYNVPTLVYQNKRWNSNPYSWNDNKISAPYLTSECGSFFTIDSFEKKLKEILSSNLKPQIYCKEHLSDIKSIQYLFDIINKHPI